MAQPRAAFWMGRGATSRTLVSGGTQQSAWGAVFSAWLQRQVWCVVLFFWFFLKKIPGKRAWVKEVLQQHPVARRDGGACVCPEPWPASIHRNRRAEGREPRGWAPSPCVCRCPHMSCSVGKPTGPSLLWPCCKLWRCPCPRQGPSPRAPCRGSLPHHGRCGSC